MKNQTRHKPTAGKFSLLRQLCNFIPPHLMPQLARQTGVEEQSRTFSPWSHIVSLLYAQLTHALGLNDMCDALRRAPAHSRPCAEPRRRPAGYLASATCRLPERSKRNRLCRRVDHVCNNDGES
jgi:hypothetical protein